MKSTLERARSYIAAMPPAVSGDGGHAAAFAVAKALCHDFALSLSDASTLFEEYNQRCDPPWSAKEIAHKLESAGKLTHAKRARGALREPKTSPVFRPSAELGTLGTLKINSRPSSKVGTLGTVFSQSLIYGENIPTKLSPHTELSEKDVSLPSQIEVLATVKEPVEPEPALTALEGVEAAPQAMEPASGKPSKPPATYTGLANHAHLVTTWFQDVIHVSSHRPKSNARTFTREECQTTPTKGNCPVCWQRGKAVPLRATHCPLCAHSARHRAAA